MTYPPAPCVIPYSRPWYVYAANGRAQIDKLFAVKHKSEHLQRDTCKLYTAMHTHRHRHTHTHRMALWISNGSEAHVWAAPVNGRRSGRERAQDTILYSSTVLFVCQTNVSNCFSMQTNTKNIWKWKVIKRERATQQNLMLADVLHQKKKLGILLPSCPPPQP